METKVVNLYRDPYDVYIGRGGQGRDGYFGNPFHLPKKHTDADRARCIEQYKKKFWERVCNDLVFKTRILGLRGKVLGCFCKPQPCHGDVIVDYLKWYEEENP